MRGLLRGDSSERTPMTTGTSYFVSRAAAVRYYADYESGTRSGKRFQAEHAVDTKLAEGSIHIGEPPLKPGETLSVIDAGTRYAVTTC